MTRWFEEIALDRPIALGQHVFAQDEIVDFAQTYEPHAVHIAPGAARSAHGDGPVASGWHVAAVGHRVMVERLVAEEAIVRAEGGVPGVSGPSPGINAMRFVSPVRPGDTLSYTLAVTSKRRSNSIPGWGLLFNRIQARNQDDVLVYEAEVVGFSKLRDYKPTLRVRLATLLASLRQRMRRSP